MYRAACLQRLGCPEFALTDLELAAESGYQQASMFKLLERRAQCLVTLRRYKEARVAFEEALDAVKLAKLDRKKKEKFHKDIQSGLEKIDQEMSSSSSPLPSSEPGGQKEAILTVGKPRAPRLCDEANSAQTPPATSSPPPAPCWRCDTRRAAAGEL